VATTAAAGDVTSAPLDAPAAAPAASGPAQVITPAQAPTAAPAGEAQTLIQAGTFTTEANANAACEAMQGAGLQATVRRSASNGNTFWVVLVGPAGTRADRNRTLEKVKSMGYPDAFLVRG
jgi:cell division septation protein DedD